MAILQIAAEIRTVKAKTYPRDYEA